jgi:hypothetical protein
VKLSDDQRRAYELGFHEGASQTASRLAAHLRAVAAAPHGPEPTTLLGRMRAALVEELSSAWRERFEGVARDIEQQAVALQPKTRELRSELKRPLWRELLGRLS